MYVMLYLNIHQIKDLHNIFMFDIIKKEEFMTLDEKYIKLKNYLQNLGNAVVAFSSGVDSTFLLKTAYDILGDNLIAVTAKSCSFPKRELNEAIDFCKSENIKHIIVESDELKIEGFKNNPPNRCYLCKKELFEKIWKTARENNIQNVIEGSNLDDNGDYRPGLTAIKELNVKSPLCELGFTKEEIRILSKQKGLKTADKQSFACLASRFVYGEKITEEKLERIDKAEQLLLDLGFNQVRVRIHNNIARIEVIPYEFEKIIKNKEQIVKFFKEIGFCYVTMDLQGYRIGSMNEVLKF